MGCVLAVLIGFLGYFDLAEEAAEEAFALAAEAAPRRGAGESRARPMTTARNRAIDWIRRDRTLPRRRAAGRCPNPAEEEVDETTFPDERPELLFTAATRRWTRRLRSR